MDDQSAFHEALGILTSRFPNELSTHYYNAIQLAIDGKWIASEDEIKTAERLGLPESDAQGLLATGIHKRALFWHAVHTAGYLLVAWVCGLLLLFGAGKAFSKLTLSQIERADATVTVSGSESRLRRIYRLINVAGVYYYVSLPFVIVLVLALAGGVTYGFLVVGQVPIKLVVILVIGALVTVYKMIHSLFVRVKSEPPGRRLTREEAPDLWNVTNEVAQSLGTRPLDEIRVTPGTQMAVYETGSFTERRQDRGRPHLGDGIGPGTGLRPEWLPGRPGARIRASFSSRHGGR